MKCEICHGKFKSIDKHHITSRSYGGSNLKSNLANLCCNCHRKVHTGEIIIEGKFPSTGENGLTLIHRKYNEPSIMNLPLPKVFLLTKE